MYKVYKQMPPEPTGLMFNRVSEDGGVYKAEWYAAKLKFLGKAETMEEAKLLTPHPILEDYEVKR